MLTYTVHRRHDVARETLIFLHVPKTAGISVSRAILPHFPEDEVYHVRNPEHGKAPVFSKAHGTVDQFKALSEAQRRSYRCILGHMHFGLHEQVPGPAAYVTLLRDPVDRVLSQFGQYSRMVRNDELGQGVRPLSFEEFCRVKARTVDNHQTRFLCGWQFDEHPRKASLDRAKANLRTHFRVVGTVERFDETMLALHEAHGWPDVSHFRENVGTQRLSREDVDPELLASIERLNWLDRELHAAANSLLDAAIGRWRRLSFLARRTLRGVLERFRVRA